MRTWALKVNALLPALGGPLLVFFAATGAAPAGLSAPTAEVLRERLPAGNTETAIREAFERICLEDGKHWDDIKRECVYLMRSKD